MLIAIHKCPWCIARPRLLQWTTYQPSPFESAPTRLGGAPSSAIIMRELKFRAWDKITKQIAPVKIIEWITGVPCSIYLTLTDKVTGHACMVERTDQSAALMQFTGLKDEKDKDIYEGDILAEWCDE